MASLRKTVSWRMLFAAPLVFSFLCFVEVPSDPSLLDGSPASPEVFFAAYLIGAVGACAIIVVTAVWRPRRYLGISPMLAMLPIIGGFALTSLYSAAQFGTPLQIPLGAFCVGAGSGILLALWAEAFADLEPATVAPTTFALFACAFALKFCFTPWAQGPFNLLIIGGCALLSALPLEYSRTSSVRASSPRHETEAARSVRASWAANQVLSWKLVALPFAGCALYGLLLGFAWGNVIAGEALPHADSLGSLIIDGVKCLTALAFLLLWKLKESRRLSASSTPLGAGLLLLGWMLSLPHIPWVSAVSYGATGAGGALLEIAFWLATVRATRGRPGESRFWFCLTRGLLGLIILGGFLVSPLFDSMGRELFTPLCCVVFFIIAASLGQRSSSAAGDEDRQLRNDSASRADNDIPSREENTRSSAIETLALAHELSPRETEVFSLFVRGYSTNRISEELVVSPHTVKTHIKRIYGKLDVHSKNELIDFLQQWEQERK